jgi:hypothetical protein
MKWKGFRRKRPLPNLRRFPRTEQNDEKVTGYPVLRSRFEPGTSRIRVLTNLFGAHRQNGSFCRNDSFHMAQELKTLPVQDRMMGWQRRMNWMNVEETCACLT